jgi:methionine-rich copper-binding protein CopC
MKGRIKDLENGLPIADGTVQRMAYRAQVLLILLHRGLRRSSPLWIPSSRREPSMAGRPRNQSTRVALQGPIRIALAALFLVGLGVWPDVATAQQALRSSDPRPGARLARSPCVLRLTFGERVEMGLTDVVILRSERIVVPLRELRRKPGMPATVIAVPRALLSSGEYIVEWRAGAPDGHVTRGRFTFAVTAVASQPPTRRLSPSAGQPKCPGSSPQRPRP